jgi:crotonobetainyl-CoA:carnitine CoA-transferase CaiB-like acyl-CoA transferase
MRNLGYDTDLNTAFEVDNRGKRSLVLDLEKPQAREVVERLVREADVFLTNLTQPRRERYGLTFEALSAVNPRLVYTSLTGYGTQGRALAARLRLRGVLGALGIMASLGEPPSPPPLCAAARAITRPLNLVSRRSPRACATARARRSSPTSRSTARACGRSRAICPLR